MRLAYLRGHLTRRHASRMQEWALEYWTYLDKRDRYERDDRTLREQCFHLAPDRWIDLYGTPDDSTAGIYSDDDEIPVQIDDRDALDEWYETIARPRNINGADVPAGIAGMR